MENKGLAQSATFLKDHMTMESPMGSVDATVPRLRSWFAVEWLVRCCMAGSSCPLLHQLTGASVLSRERFPQIFVKNGPLPTFPGRWPDTKNVTFIVKR